MTTPASEHADALIAALLDLDRHLSSAAWEQPTRLFALVLTDDLVVAEPELAAQLGLRTSADGGPIAALTAVEQDTFVETGDLLVDLAAVAWPAEVFGCAVSTERTFLPAAYEDDLPDDPEKAAAVVANHPRREDIRVVIGVDRAGNRHGVARLASQPEELLGGADLVPGLAVALSRTLT